MCTHPAWAVPSSPKGNQWGHPPMSPGNQQSETSRHHQWELELIPSAQVVSLTVIPAKAWIHPKDQWERAGYESHIGPTACSPGDTLKMVQE